MKKKGYIILSVLMFTILFSSMDVARMLRVSTVTATRIVNIINAYSSIARIISILAIVFGGIITVGFVTTVKSLMKRYGKRYAVNW